MKDKLVLVEKTKDQIKDEKEDEEDGNTTTISDEEVQRLRDLIRQENESASK